MYFTLHYYIAGVEMYFYRESVVVLTRLNVLCLRDDVSQQGNSAGWAGARYEG